MSRVEKISPIKDEDFSNNADTAKKNEISGDTMEREFRKWVCEVALTNKRPNLYEFCIDWIGGILIHEALSFTGGNRTKAAKLLGLSRPTLHAKIEKYQLKIETSVKKEQS